jgi:hypothetical protein
VLLIHPYIIKLTHKGSARVNVMVKCPVLVKMNGNRPRKGVIICPSTQLCVVSSVHLYYSYIFIHYMFRLSGSHLQM